MDKPSENSGFLNDKFSGQEVNPSADLWDGVAAGAGTGPLAGAFSEFETSPSTSVWNGISAALHPERRRAIIWWFSSAASILLLLGISTFLFINYGESTSQYTLDQTDVDPWNERTTSPTSQSEDDVNTSLVESRSIDDVPESTGWPTFESIRPTEQEVGNGSSVAQNEPGHKNDLQINPKNLQAQSDKNNVINPIDNNQHNIDSLNEMPTIPGSVAHGLPDAALAYYPFIPPPSNNNAGSLPNDEKLFAMAGSFSPYINSASSSSSESRGDATISSSSTEETDSDIPVINFLEESNGQSNTETQYSPPLSYGLQFIAFNHKKISLGAGVEITTLQGKSTTSYGSYLNEQEFSQKYIGIPIFAQIDLLTKKKFCLYTKAGGVYDIGWRSETQVTDYDASNQSSSYAYSFRPGNQARLTSGLGVRSRFSDTFSIFLEGNGSLLIYQANSNLWSGRKFWPNMGVGLSVAF